jgi:predicted DNA-binding protein
MTLTTLIPMSNGSLSCFPQLQFSAACYTLLYIIAQEPIMFALRLPAEVEDRLDHLARRTGQTKTFHAREAIIKHLDEFEEGGTLEPEALIGIIKSHVSPATEEIDEAIAQAYVNGACLGNNRH